MYRNAIDRRNGSILVVLLWILMAMSVLCISFAKAVRVEANAAINNRMMASAYYLAQAGINETIYKLVTYRLEAPQRSQGNQADKLEPMDIDLGKVTLNTDIGDVEVDISDEYGKINVNRANKDLLVSLLLQLGADEERADIISDSILDWRDPDEDHHLNGAESDYYLSLDPPYKAKNARFDTVEELLLVRGVDADLFYGHSYQDETGRSGFVMGLNRCLTVYGGSTGINVNSAPYPVLLAVGFPPETARQVINERSQQPFKDQQDFNSRVANVPGREQLKAPVITRPPSRSNYFSLVATARLKNSRIKKTVFAIVRLNARYPLKHSIVYWNENYFMQDQKWD